MRELGPQTVEKRVRLDVFLVRHWPDLSRQDIEELVQSGAVLIDGQPALKPGQYLEPGEHVEAQAPETQEEEPELLPPPVGMTVLYEDKLLLGVDKPANMPTHARRHDQEGQTLAAQLAERFPDLAHVGGVDRAGILQRLGDDVSGAMLVARDRETYRTMKREVKRGRVEHLYTVLVEGHLTGSSVINAPLGNAKWDRRRLTVAREGRPAETEYRALRNYKSTEGIDYTLLEVKPDASRMHQMRVHLSWYGYPVVGDIKYGSRQQRLLMDRLFIHLTQLSFAHPQTEEWIHVRSPLPAELSSILEYMSRPKYLR